MRLLNLKCLAVILLSAWSDSAPAQPGSSPAPRPSSFAPTALDLYAIITGRTVLRPALLPRLRESITTRALADTNHAVEVIEKELAANGIDVVRVGQLFAWVLPEGWKETPLAAQLAQIKLPPTRQSSVTAEADQRVPAGMIDLQDMPIPQVLEIYSQLRNRTVLRPSTMAPARIRFTTQSAMTRDEALYGLTVVLAMNGLAVIDDGDRFVQVVPLPRVAGVIARAPKPDANAVLIQADEAPKFGFTSGSPSRAPQFPPTADGLVAYCAFLTGRKSAPSESLGRLSVFLKIEIPLTKAELIYAIETTLALNNLTIVPLDEDSIRVGRPSEIQNSQPQPAVAK